MVRSRAAAVVPGSPRPSRLVAALSFLVARFLPVLAFHSECPFRALTGLPCASCGMTHAFVALARGDAGGGLVGEPAGRAARRGRLALRRSSTSARVAAGPPLAAPLRAGLARHGRGRRGRRRPQLGVDAAPRGDGVTGRGPAGLGARRRELPRRLDPLRAPARALRRRRGRPGGGLRQHRRHQRGPHRRAAPGGAHPGPRRRPRGRIPVAVTASSLGDAARRRLAGRGRARRLPRARLPGLAALPGREGGGHRARGLRRPHPVAHAGRRPGLRRGLRRDARWSR